MVHLGWMAAVLVLRMPAVFSSLEAGRICRSKAWMFVDLCADLTAEQTRVVCERLLPRAGRLTTGELAALIKKLVISLDPDWVARRCDRGAGAQRDRVNHQSLNASYTCSGLSK